MEQKQIKTKTIYARWVCEQLLQLGFRPIDTFPNPLKPEFMCWQFEWTEEFDKALTNILSGQEVR